MNPTGGTLGPVHVRRFQPSDLGLREGQRSIHSDFTVSQCLTKCDVTRCVRDHPPNISQFRTFFQGSTHTTFHTVTLFSSRRVQWVIIATSMSQRMLSLQLFPDCS
jgi:hypothetical protein